MRWNTVTEMMMSMELRIKSLLLKRPSFVIRTKAQLVVLIIMAMLLPSCALNDYTKPYAGIPQQTPHTHVPASRPVNGPVDELVTLDGPITLARAIEISLANNPDLAAAQYNVDTARAERDVAFGAILPKISMEAGYEMYREDRLIQPRRPGTSEALGFTDQLVLGDFVLSMPLFMGGRLINQIKAAELITESTRKQLLYSQTELVFNVSSVFYSMLGQREMIDSLIFSQNVLKEHHNVVTKLIETQKAAKVDLLRTEVRLADIEQRLIHERNVLKTQGILLATLLGISQQHDSVEIEGKLTLEDVPPNLDQGLAIAFGNRKDYQSLKTKVEAQQRYVDVAKGELLPEISLRASYGGRWSAISNDMPTDRNEVGVIGAYMVIPIFEGGRIIAGIKREIGRLNAQREMLRKLELEIQLEVETAVSDIESARSKVGVTQKAVEQARESLRIEGEKYNLGKGAIVDVLDAQSALLDSQMNYYRALADYNTALARFRLAIGDA